MGDIPHQGDAKTQDQDKGLHGELRAHQEETRPAVEEKTMKGVLIEPPLPEKEKQSINYGMVKQGEFGYARLMVDEKPVVVDYAQQRMASFVDSWDFLKNTSTVVLRDTHADPQRIQEKLQDIYVSYTAKSIDVHSEIARLQSLISQQAQVVDNIYKAGEKRGGEEHRVDFIVADQKLEEAKWALEDKHKEAAKISSDFFKDYTFALEKNYLVEVKQGEEVSYVPVTDKLLSFAEWSKLAFNDQRGEVHTNYSVKEPGLSQVNVSMREELLTRPTEEQAREIQTIFHPGQPQPVWFKELPAGRQQIIKDIFKDPEGGIPSLESIQDKFQSLPSSLKHMPGLSNMGRHHFTVTDKNGEEVTASTTIRSSSLSPNELGMANQSVVTEIMRIAQLNLQELIQNNIHYFADKYVDKWELKDPDKITLPWAETTVVSRTIRDENIPVAKGKLDETSIIDGKNKASANIELNYQERNHEIVIKDRPVAIELSILSNNHPINAFHVGKVKFIERGADDLVDVRINTSKIIENTNTVLYHVKDKLGPEPEVQATVNDVINALHSTQQEIDASPNATKGMLKENSASLPTLEKAIEKLENSLDKVAACFQEKGQQKAHDISITLNVLKHYVELTNTNTVESKTGEERRGRNVFKASMELLIYDKLGGANHITCKSGKDRTAYVIMHKNAMLQYEAQYKELPRYDDSPDKRAKFVNILSDQIVSMHHQHASAVNAPMSAGLKSMEKFAAPDVLAAVEAKSPCILTQNNQLSHLNKLNGHSRVHKYLNRPYHTVSEEKRQQVDNYLTANGQTPLQGEKKPAAEIEAVTKASAKASTINEKTNDKEIGMEAVIQEMKTKGVETKPKAREDKELDLLEISSRINKKWSAGGFKSHPAADSNKRWATQLDAAAEGPKDRKPIKPSKSRAAHNESEKTIEPQQEKNIRFKDLFKKFKSAPEAPETLGPGSPKLK